MIRFITKLFTSTPVQHDWELTGELFADYRRTKLISQTYQCRNTGAIRSVKF